LAQQEWAPIDKTKMEGGRET